MSNTVYSFVPDPSTNFSVGQEPEIVQRLKQLANDLHENIYGISGYRTPAQSVAAGGFSDDPHTRGQAADIGVNGSLRASAQSLTNAQLASVGLWRPFDLDGQDANEVNHVQLLPADGGPQVAGEETRANELAFNALHTNAGHENAPEQGPLPRVEHIVHEATSLPQKIAEEAVHLLVSAFGDVFVKAALYTLLAGGGMVLLVTGISRATGAHPVGAAKRAAAGAAIAGAAV